MANMSYCRFHNTYLDLLDCRDNLEAEDLSGEEKAKRLMLVELCRDIVEMWDKIRDDS